MTKRTRPAGLRIRLVFSNRSWIGPGKADLLELIRETGSIAAAGRKLGMSYKRAWSLSESLNAMFQEPVIESSRGGAAFGGARLTKTGEKVLDLYRRLEAKAEKSAAAQICDLEALLAATPAEQTVEMVVDMPIDMSNRK
ncbi:MAG: LysR family transcriptional regulator [Hyphomicrobiaceae bacterium]|nr:LysR family transcriptional regulator [Hyphomicrobiaceae bacterium]